MARLDRTTVMAVLNVTPDSFSDGGRYADVASAVKHGIAEHEAGADIVDVGGESTRPGAERVPADEEQRRVLPVVRALVSEGVPVSIDTMRASTADGCPRGRRVPGERRQRRPRRRGDAHHDRSAAGAVRRDALARAECADARRSRSTTTWSATCGASCGRGSRPRSAPDSTRRTSSSIPVSALPRRPTTTGRCWGISACSPSSVDRCSSGRRGSVSSVELLAVDGAPRPMDERDAATDAVSALAARGGGLVRPCP